MDRIILCKPSPRFQNEFLESARRSRAFHQPWGRPPSTPDEFVAYLNRCRRLNHVGYFLLERESQSLVGVVNLTNIVRGGFQSAYLGYFLFLPFTGRGYMTEGLGMVFRKAFGELRLHRLEANIRPENECSNRLVQRLGFRMEGLSHRYLKIGGRWRDHERWALLAEDWKQRNR